MGTLETGQNAVGLRAMLDRLKTLGWTEGATARIDITDWLYWITMLTAGVLGTALGDWFAEDQTLNLGFI